LIAANVFLKLSIAMLVSILPSRTEAMNLFNEEGLGRGAGAFIISEVTGGAVEVFLLSFEQPDVNVQQRNREHPMMK
jgi:hypothetical protein